MRMVRRVVAMTLVILMLFMGCGLMNIASFFVPVVYATENLEEDGNLDQIDEEAEVSEQSIDKTKLVEDQCDEYTTVFRKDDGTNIAKFYSYPVRYEDEEGNLIDIDASLTELTEDEKLLDEGIMKYKTKASPVDTYLPETLSENSPIVVKYKDYSITLLPITSDGKIDKTILSENASDIEKELAKEDKKVVSVNNGYTKTEEVTDLYDEKSEKKTAITYSVLDENNENVIDYEYIPDQFGVKENIILYQKPEINVFEFYLEVKGCYAEIDEYGEVVIYDRQTDEIVGSVPAPYMIDADGKENKEEAYFESVHYELIEKAEGKYFLNVVVSEDYLNDPDTAYPVTIDPSVTMIGSTYMRDAYVMSNGWANYNFYSSDVRIMRCGYSALMSCHTRTYIHFPTLKTTVLNHLITKADFKAWEWDNSPPYAIMTLYRVTSAWNPSTITWNTQPSVDTSTRYGTCQATGSASHIWDVRGLVGKWASGTADYGMSLRATVESTSVANRVDLYGSRTGATSYRPYIYVEYQDPSVLNTPTVTSGGVNSGYSNVSLSFSKVYGTSQYMLKIIGEGGSYVWRDITNEITLNGSTYTWNSSGKTIFSGYTGFPNSAATVLGGNGSYQFYIQTKTSYSSVNSNTRTITLSDNTSPNTISTANISQQADSSNPGKALLDVSFSQTTDLPSDISCGLKHYLVKLYVKNINDTFTQVGSTVTINYNSSTSTYNYQFSNISDNNIYKVSVQAYDNNLNYSPVKWTSEITVPNYTPPGAPQNLQISPSSWTSTNAATISWGAIEGSGIIDRVEYSLDGSSYYTTGKSAENDSFDLEDKEDISQFSEGETTIYVRAVYTGGLTGAASQVVYKKDTTMPTVTLSGLTEDQQVETNLILNGVINDANIVEWEVGVTSYHFLIFEQYTEVCDSSSLAPENMNIDGQICIIDLSDPDYGISLNKSFKLTVMATDAAGQTTTVDYNLTRVASASNIDTVFEIDNDADTVNGQWLIDQTQSIITPIALDGYTLPTGTNQLFIDNELTTNINGDMVLDISDEEVFYESSTHYALVKITDAQGDTYYNAPTHEQAILNDDIMISDWEVLTDIVVASGSATLDGELSGSMESFRTGLSGNLVEFTINATENVPSGTSISYYVKLDPEGNYIPVSPNTHYNVEDLLSGSIDAYSITVKVEMTATDLGTLPTLTNLTVDTLYVNAGDAFTVNMLENIAPANLNVTEDINYMAYLRWDEGSAADSSVTYDVYRSTDQGTLFAEENIIQSGISEQYWYDYNLNYGTSFYYGVKAVKAIDSIERSSAPSNIATGTVVDENELQKRLGLQDYWGYSSFDTVVGNGYIEQSQGNLVYQETDAEVPGTLLGLVMRRTYNAQATTTTPMGTGWDFSFNTNLYVSYDEYGNEEGMILKDGDGTFHFFELYDDDSNPLTPDVYKSPKGIHMQLSYVDDHSEIYRYDNITYTFNDSNQLVSLSEPNGNALSFVYDESDGNLLSVTTSNGDSIVFTYNAMNQLVSALLPDGVEIQYEYTLSSGQYLLDEVTIEGNLGETLERYFGYSNGLLTDIEDGMSNQYDIAYTVEGKFDSVTYPSTDTLELSYASGITTTTCHVNGDSIETCSTSSASFNSAGNITSTTDPNGQVIDYTYDEYYNLTSLSYDYTLDSFDDVNGLTQSSETDTYTFTYDGNYNLLTMTQPDGKIISYMEYNSFNKPTIMTVSKSGYATLQTDYGYDTYGNVTSVTDPTDEDVIYTYTDGNLATATDRYGFMTTYSYDNDGKLIGTTLSGETVSVISYDAMWRPLIIEDAEGNQTQYQYDYLGNIEYVTLAYGTSDAVTYQCDYNMNNQLVTVVDPLDQQTTYSYDSLGRTTGATIDSKTWGVTYAYEDVTITDIAFLGENFGSVTIENAMKVTETLPGNIAVNISWYDQSGRLVKQTGNGTSIVYFYDERGLPIKAVDITGGVVRVVYDEMGQQTHAIIKNGSSYIVTETEYDYLGNVVSTTDGIDVETTYTYDDLARLLSVTADSEVTSYTYDNVGYGGIYNETTDANGRKSLSVFDAFGNKIKQIEFSDDTNTAYKTTLFEYDGNGNLIRKTNADNSVVEYSYDGRGNLIETKQKVNVSATESTYRTVYTYDDNDRRVSMVDYQTVDSTESIITQSDYSYDTLNRVTQLVQDGSPIYYTYNNDGTVATIQYPGTLAVPDDETLQSDPDNTYFTIHYNYVYKAATATYLIDTVGVTQPLTSTEVTVRDYDYLADGRIDTITDTVGFDTASSTDVVQSYTYNDLGLVSNITYTEGTTVKESYDYTYDDRGYITTESLINNYFPTAKDGEFTYLYDDVGRLTSSCYTDNNTSTSTTRTYTYDAVGNRLTKSDGTYDYTYTIGDYNQISHIDKEDASNELIEEIDFTYDTNGTLAQEATSSYEIEERGNGDYNIRTTITKAYDYDYADMMREADVTVDISEKKTNQLEGSYTSVYSDSAGDTYIYNGDGQRIKKITDGIEAKYYYSGNVILYTADEDNNKISGNIATPSGEIIATRDHSYVLDENNNPNPYATNYYFYHYDIRGSVTTILKPNATIEQGYTYDEFGNSEAVSQTSLLTNEYSYTGAISDSTTGLTYMNARYYNPATGSFTSQDTYYGEAYSPWTQHLYSYTGGNPVNYIDPTGHSSISVGEGLGGIDWEAVWNTAAGYAEYGPIIAGVVLFLSIIFTPRTVYAPTIPLPSGSTGTSDAGTGDVSISTGNSGSVSAPSPTYNAGDNYTLSPTEPAVEPLVYVPDPISARSILDILAFSISNGQDKTVKEILKTKKGSIKNAPLPPGSPNWGDILNYPLSEIYRRAQSGDPGFKTIKKLLTDGRFNK